MKTRIPLILFVIALSVQPVFAIPHRIFPLAPSDLVGYLPPAPSQWTMNASIAQNSFTAGWITAVAERDFKQDPPPPTPGVQPKPFVPATMSIYLTDTGYKNDYNSMFVAPKGASDSSITFLRIKGFPARMTKGTDKDKTVDMTLLIKNRFLFEIRATNLADDEVKKYAESLDFTRLLSAPDTGGGAITNPVILSRVDELHPQNTRSYPLFWAPAGGQR